ncbi:B3 domain-containing protein REM16 [Neltuma alba]|uniref:B3 domain-containing protein REM16 n=1 Tax=Neltuma alba TaxID=207710 RepID=UPI0010A36F39|nr:B3 domain-containing protein REM16-like [Prosopis alba]XP_028757607.1 B3 domain-containing protein REM16-like [Prosopis alba]
MGENCESCRSWVDDIYWTRFQFVHFAYYLPKGFDRQLTLPRSFSDNLRKKLPDNVTLRGPGGDEWNVGLTTTNDTLHFTHGWQQFVEDHCLEENDLLVFKYNNESQFDVLIFGRGGSCEKAASYFVRKCGHTNKRIRGNRLKEVNFRSNIPTEHASPEKFVHGESMGVPAVIPSEISSKEARDAGVEFASPVTAIPVAVADVQTKQRGGTRGSKTRRDRANLIADAEPSSASRSKTNEIYISNRRPVTEDEKTTALQLAQAACTDQGFYIIMRPTHVYKRFYASIPSKWLAEHLFPHSEDVILRTGGNEWHAKYSFEHGRRTGGLTGGWKQFALDNNLEEFDVCVFELVGQGKPLIMDVTIFRVIEDYSPLQNVSYGGKRGPNCIQSWEVDP